MEGGRWRVGDRGWEYGGWEYGDRMVSGWEPTANKVEGEGRVWRRDGEWVGANNLRWRVGVWRRDGEWVGANN